MVKRRITRRVIIIVNRRVASSLKATIVIINTIRNMERREDTNQGRNGSPAAVIKFSRDKVCFLNTNLCFERLTLQLVMTVSIRVLKRLKDSLKNI